MEKIGYGFIKKYDKTCYRQPIPIDLQIQTIENHAKCNNIKLLKIYQDLDTDEFNKTMFSNIVNQLHEDEILITFGINYLPLKPLHKFMRIYDKIVEKKSNLFFLLENFNVYKNHNVSFAFNILVNDVVTNRQKMMQLSSFLGEHKLKNTNPDDNCELCRLLSNEDNIVTRGNQLTLVKYPSNDNPNKVIMINNNHKKDFYEADELDYNERLEELKSYITILCSNVNESKYLLNYHENVEHSFIEFTKF